jgi:hypothetical protein
MCITKVKNFGMWLHVASGIVILIITITMSMLAFNFYAWHLRFNESIHSALGFIVLISICLITLLGFCAWGTMAYGRGTNPSRFWSFTTKASFFHKLLGYLTLALAQASILLGVIRYNDRSHDHRLGTSNIVVFFVIWAALEVNHQIKSRQRVELSGGVRSRGVRVIGVQEFRVRVSQKREKLVIMEDVVVDVGRYMESHPGGK